MLPIPVTQTATTTLVADDATAAIRLHGLSLTADATCTLQLQDTLGVALTGTFHVGPGSPAWLDYTPETWGDTAKGKGVKLVQAGVANVGGQVLFSRRY